MNEIGSAVVLAQFAAARPGSASHEFARMLTGASRDRFSGTLLVTGDPGGSFRLRRGAVVEVASPGAPGVDTLLLRSGRAGGDRAPAVRSAAEGGAGSRPAAPDRVGAAELQLVCVMAALDAALAMGIGRIDGFAVDHETPAQRPVAPEGIEAEWLLREAERRIGALDSLGLSISPFHDRLARGNAATALLSGSVAGERREILLRANGRNTSRDIAFLLGRSLYAVTVDVLRMLGEGIVEAVLPAEGGPDRPPVPRDDRWQTPAGTAARPLGGAVQLPRRRPGASGINEVLPLRPVADRWRPPPALVAKYRAAEGHP
ncbi:MarR family transcriptional regulator [Kitasatospora sp. NPDC093558]|uniref:MarR family transcriptional regulator n=1 Tax=Kitasatospora sp. NPDC093558 TaxID=3155201 RepID=UPI00341D06DD